MPMLPSRRVRNMQLLPELTAQENLARMMAAAIGDWDLPRLPALMSKFRDSEIVRDLIWDHFAAAWRNFIVCKVKLHRYNRNFNFFQNVLSSVKSTWSNIKEVYWREDTRRHQSTSMDFSVSEDATFGDLLKNGDARLYLPDVNKERLPFDKLTPYMRAERLRDDYKDYLLECQELGVKPVSFERYQDLNRGEGLEGLLTGLAVRCSSAQFFQTKKKKLMKILRKERTYDDPEDGGLFRDLPPLP